MESPEEKKEKRYEDLWLKAVRRMLDRTDTDLCEYLDPPEDKEFLSLINEEDPWIEIEEREAQQ